MFTNRDARDVGSLEEVFRSHEFGRVTDAMGGRGVFDPAGREGALFAQEFGRPLTAVLSHDVEGGAEPRRSAGGGGPGALSEETEVPEQLQQVGPSRDGAPSGQEHAGAPSKRRATRYGTIASVTALAALVAAGVMAGVGHHARSTVSAQGKHHTARPHSGQGGPGAASTGSRIPSGSLMTAAGSGGLSSGKAMDAGLRAGNAPGVHVSLVGPSIFTGNPTSPAASPTPSGTSPGVGSGATGSLPPSGTTNPVAPVASPLGNTVSAVGSSVATAASQLGSSVPAAASATGVANTIVNTLDQAVSASTE
jgi:hypothetical protein